MTGFLEHVRSGGWQLKIIRFAVLPSAKATGVRERVRPERGALEERKIVNCSTERRLVFIFNRTLKKTTSCVWIQQEND
jgi:hypothetical protein